jgi:hypothetical protein
MVVVRDGSVSGNQRKIVLLQLQAVSLINEAGGLQVLGAASMQGLSNQVITLSSAMLRELVVRNHSGLSWTSTSQ